MQRGAQKRDPEPPITNAELYRQSPPLLTDAEVAHFQFGDRTAEQFFTPLSDILSACDANKLAAGQISRTLNREGVKTACGSPWTPRLAWFLMATWRTVRAQRAEADRDAEPVSSPHNGRNRFSSSVNDQSKVRAGISEMVPYQRALRPYFRNPTLGEVFPVLSGLLSAMSGSQAHEGPGNEMEDGPGPISAPEQKQGSSEIRRSEPVSYRWRRYFGSDEGHAQLVRLVRLNRQILISAENPDYPFLGFLRSRKFPHPRGQDWTHADAEQVRLAIIQGLHLERKEDRSPRKAVTEIIRRDGTRVEVCYRKRQADDHLEKDAGRESPNSIRRQTLTLNSVSGQNNGSR